VPTDERDTLSIEAGPKFELLLVDWGGTYAAVVTGIEESETSEVPSTVVAVTLSVYVVSDCSPLIANLRSLQK
jgi:hypothetical protein